MYLMELIVDNRERDLLEILDGVGITRENLDLGDIVIKYADGSVFAVIERKTWSDLAASIKDGRYHNQKKRLMDTYPVSKLYYIFEGSGDFSECEGVLINGLDKNSLLSCVHNTMMRDNIKVVRTVSLRDTAHFLMGMFSRVNANPGKYSGSCIEAGPEQIVKHKIRDAREYFERALCQVPGVSMKTAAAISIKYSTMMEFVSALASLSLEQKLKVLKDITTKDSKGKDRRISETVCKSLVAFLLNE